jgi:phosphate transport system permease protein
MIVNSKVSGKRRLFDKLLVKASITSVVLVAIVICALVFSLLSRGLKTFTHLTIDLPVSIQSISVVNQDSYYNHILLESLRSAYKPLQTIDDIRPISNLLSINYIHILKDQVAAADDDNHDIIIKFSLIPEVQSWWDQPSDHQTNLSKLQLEFLQAMKAKGYINSSFNWGFFTNSASREAEIAGIGGAIVGSLLTLLVCFIVAIPIGIGAGIYLEKFLKQNILKTIIEVTINNLAAVPSIIFGLLGLSILLNLFNIQRSSALVGGLVLAMVILPTVIVITRSAIKSVPQSMMNAALGLGATKMQAVIHHTLPYAMPGIITGVILSLARALGETAPLLMIGMVAFIVDIPTGITDSATTIPVQIFLWSNMPEKIFNEKTAAAIIVLFLFLILLNSLAFYLRKRYEKKW